MALAAQVAEKVAVIVVLSSEAEVASVQSAAQLVDVYVAKP